MPPKRAYNKAVIPKTDRVTRSRSLSGGRVQPEQGHPDQGPRPSSRSSDTSTLVPDSSELSVWELSDGSISDTDFASFIETTSTQDLSRILPDPSTLPPPAEIVYSPNEFDTTQFFHSAIDMAEGGNPVGNGNIPELPAVPEDMSPQVMFMMQMFQRQTALAAQAATDAALVAEDRFRQQRADDLRAQADTMKAMQAQSQAAFNTLADEVKRLSTRAHESARPSSIKLPSFDLEKDRSTFKQWKDRWNMHIRAHKIHLIADEDERRERCLTELTAALSNDTLKWIANRDFSNRDRNNSEALIQAFEDHIRESTNPTVTVVELFTMKRQPHETADHLNARINEKLNEVDFTVITDLRDYFGMTATIIANDPVLRKRMYLDKVNTYAKAHAAVKADEQATIHSKMVSEAAAASSSDLNYVSTYKKGQKAASQSSQSQRGGYSGSHTSRGTSSTYADRGGGSHRGGTRGGYTRGRGGYNQSSSRPQSPERSSRDRNRSNNRDQSRGRSQSTASQPDKCESCGNSGHPRKTCWAFTKDCRNCGKLGHIAPACRQPLKHEAASGGDASYLEGSLQSIVATAPEYDCFSLASAAKRDRGVPAIQPLETVRVTFTPLDGAPTISLEVIPDTGANVTAIPATTATGIGLEQTTIVLCAANRNSLKVTGAFQARLGLQGNSTNEVVYVVNGLSRPLLSRNSMKELGLIHRDFPYHDVARVNEVISNSHSPSDSGGDSVPQGRIQTPSPSQGEKPITTEHGPAFDRLINEYSDLFDGRCTQMRSADYHIELEKDVKPISYGACRSVPDPYLPALKRELEGLTEQGIVEPIDYSTPWLHPIVVVPKKGTTDIRLCVDFSKLNKYVVRPVNPQPTPWETVRNLPKGIKHFAVFDALKGYHQIPLSDD